MITKLHEDLKQQFNDVLQLNHTLDYFLSDGVEYCLMSLIDHATKVSLIHLYDANCASSALDILYKWCDKYGIPKSICLDQYDAYTNICERLNIEQIPLSSRSIYRNIEKIHQLYNDSCIKELKAFDCKTINQANEYLLNDNAFVAQLNTKFAVNPKDINVTINNTVYLNEVELMTHFTIDHICCVKSDYTVQINNTIYQLSRKALIRAGSKVIIRQNIINDNLTTIWMGRVRLDFEIIENYNIFKQNISTIQDSTPKRKTIPAKTHPFRKYKPEKVKRKQSSTKLFDFLSKQHA